MPGIIGEFLSWAGVGLPAFLFVITIVVFFHELGHFLMGRAFRVAVQSFSIGFGRELVGWTDRKGTRWKISLLPLGGYVKFAGDADATSRPDERVVAIREAARADHVAPEQEVAAIARAGEPEALQLKDSLHLKPLYQRALVVAAGPIANFILAIVIFAGLFMAIGKPSTQPIIGRVTENSAAADAGLMVGDVVRSVDGKPVTTFLEFSTAVREAGARSVQLEVARNDQAIQLRATPRATQEPDENGTRRTAYLLGVEVGRDAIGPVEAVRTAAVQTWTIVSKTMSYLGQMVTGRAGPDQLSGPLGIAKISGDMAERGFLELFGLAGLLSVSIGLINLFPIPMLDGGHLLYYAVEAVRGRPLGERAQEMGFRLGAAFVLCLMLLATFNDLVRFNLF
jgi:regulator of sigma E protease